MKLADTRRFRTKDGKEMHTFLVVEANFVEAPGLLAICEVIERREDPPMELFLHEKGVYDQLLELHKDDWVELEERKISLAQEVLDSLRPLPPVPQSGRGLLDSAKSTFQRKDSSS